MHKLNCNSIITPHSFHFQKFVHEIKPVLNRITANPLSISGKKKSVVRSHISCHQSMVQFSAWFNHVLKSHKLNSLTPLCFFLISQKGTYSWFSSKQSHEHGVIKRFQIFAFYYIVQAKQHRSNMRVASSPGETKHHKQWRSLWLN